MSQHSRFKNRSVRLLLVLMLCISEWCSATNYYFSNSLGNDSRNSLEAQHAGTPWKTIGKLNSSSSLLRPGDSVLFKGGEIFYGSIQVRMSGANSQPIVFGSYGDGGRAVISGLYEVTGWKKMEAGIYQASCPSCNVKGDNMVIINGVQQPLGRYPNKGYLNYQAHSGNSSISDNNLPNQADWTGAELVIRKNHWIIDRCSVTGITGQALNYTGGSSSQPTNGFGYFIQNHQKTLDEFGEWYFDVSNKNLEVFLGDKNPTSFKIEIGVENILFDIENCHQIKLENLILTGALQRAIQIRNAKYVSIDHCSIDLSGADGIAASGSSFLDLENSALNHSLNNAVKLDSSCHNATIRNNIIKNTGLLPGMGKSGSGNYQALSFFGEGTVAELNEIDSSGYNAIYFSGNSTLAKNNLIRYFCAVKDDGAGIYVGDWFPSSGKRIFGNIILDGVGAREGTNERDLNPAEGIYIDDNTAGVIIEWNSVTGCSDAGIKIHNAKDVQIEGNTVFGNGIQLLVAHDNLHPNSPVRNLISRNNIFFCQRADQVCVNIYSVIDDIGEVGLMDSNYYYRPSADQVVFKIVSNIWTSRSVLSNFPLGKWQDTYGQDKQSKKTPTIEIDQKNLNFEYNFSPKGRDLLGKATYISVDGMLAGNKFLLSPFRSVIIIKGASVSSKEQ